MFQQLFKSDKAPFILSVTLAVISWFVSTMVANLSDVIVLGTQQSRSSKSVVYEITNQSIKRSLANAVLNFVCINGDCLQPLPNSTAFVEDTNVAPYAILGNKICYSGPDNVLVQVTLPPSAKVRYEFVLKDQSVPTLFFIGIYKDRCPESNEQLKGIPASKLDVESLWILPDRSLTVFIVKYYFHILVSSLILAVIFLIVILFRREQPEY